MFVVAKMRRKGFDALQGLVFGGVSVRLRRGQGGLEYVEGET